MPQDAPDQFFMFGGSIKPNYFIDVIDIHGMDGMCRTGDVNQKEKFCSGFYHIHWKTEPG